MHTPDDIRRDLPPEMAAPERDSLAELGMRLQAGVPRPAPTFRGDLQRELLRERRTWKRRRTTTGRRAGALAVTYSAAGLFLLAVAAAGLTNIGPFATS